MKLPIESYFDDLCGNKLVLLLIEQLPSIIFHLIITEKYHENMIKSLIYYYYQTIANNHISNEAL